MNSLLHQAEELEAGAAADRIAYLEGLGVLTAPILDVGCGNGYGVQELRKKGIPTVGVDYSLYRLSRWVQEGRGGRQLVVADAARLPFRPGAFATVISSGMLEHIGVAERSAPYAVTALPAKHRLRASALAELRRVCSDRLVLDFPNGWFPVDFWHGDTVGAFRLHSLPDALNPSLSELRSYLPGLHLSVLPLRNRLQFHQVSRRLWGRLLSPLVRLVLRAVDRLPRTSPLLSVLYPYLVVRADRRPTRRAPDLASPAEEPDGRNPASPLITS